MGKKLSVKWPMYAIVEIAQGVKLVGLTINPKKASDSVATLNLAAARRLTGVAFIGKSLTITDPVKVEAIKAASSNPAAFVSRMNEIGEARAAGKRALKGITLLRELLGN